MAKAIPYYEVTCETHGKVSANDPGRIKRVIVGRPKNKRDRYQTGCPECRREKK